MAAPPEVLGSGLTSTRSCCTTSGSAVLCDCPGMIVDPSRSLGTINMQARQSCGADVQTRNGWADADPATEASPKEFLLIWRTQTRPRSVPSSAHVPMNLTTT
eukprot:1037986-Rhodomonas_salina.1